MAAETQPWAGVLDGRVALITGAGGGIGRAVALELGRAGASLMLVDRDAEGLEASAAAAAEIGAAACVCAADIADEAASRRYLERTRAELGRVDVLVNNAGIEGAIGEIASYDPAEFDRVVAVNLRGAFLALRGALAMMTAAGSGSIVNVASMAGLIGFPTTAAYNATKAAVINLTKSAAAEAGPHGVRVNAVCPGLIQTRMLDAVIAGTAADGPAERRREMIEGVPLRRLGEPAEVARLVRFLASDEASYITGATITIDGGITATR